MFEYILGFFGYVKVPKAAVELNIWLEDRIVKVANAMQPQTPKARELFQDMHKTCKTITRFLQSGRMLG